MSTLNDNDLFLVERDGQNHQVTSEQMSTLNDTDLLLVEREGVQYRMEAADLNLVPPEAPVAQGSIVYDNVTSNRFTDEQFTITAGAQPAAKTVTTEVKPYVVGLLDGSPSDLYSLRFDPDRQTVLNRIRSTESGSITFSVWYKPTQAGGKGTLFGLISDTGNKTVCLEVESNGTIGVDCFGANFTGTIPLDGWSHIVVTADQQNGELYINGALASSATLSYSTAPVGRTVFGAFSPDGSTNKLSGYVSQAFLVDGYALPPSVFGNYVDGHWIPKSSEQIQLQFPNYPEQPYDSRPNIDQMWSSQVTSASSSGYPPEKGFDGLLTTNALSETTTTPFTWQTNLTGVTKFEIQLRENGTAAQIPNGITAEISGQGIETTIIQNTQLSSFIEIELTDTTVSDITITGTENQLTPGIAGVKVNGRLLEDGPGDNSQNWSDFTVLTGGWNAGPAGIFNGRTDVAGGGIGDGTNNSKVTINYPFEVAVIGVYFGGRGSLRARVIGDTTETSAAQVGVNSESNLYVFASTVTNVTAIEFESVAADSIAIYGVTVNNTLLVDSGAQWNTSQVWSDRLTSDSTTDPGPGGFPLAYPRTNAFNGLAGDPVNGTTFSNGNPPGTLLRIGYITFDATGLDLEVTSDVYVYTTKSPVSDAGIVVTTSDGVFEERTLNTDPGVGTSVSCTGTLISVVVSTQDPYLRGIRIDGKLLVDGASFGNQGFFLPFDPAAVGANYSSGADWPIRTGFENFGPEKAFDGDTQETNAQSDQTSTLNFSGLGTGTVGIVTNSLTNTGDAHYTVNGTRLTASNTTETALGSRKLFTYDTPVELSTITQQGGAGALYGVYFNGQLLADHNNIGVDASGNGNNFHDQNFAVGNTSQVWSANMDDSNGDYFPGYGPSKAFDGSLNTEASTASSADGGGTLSVNNLGFTGTNQVTINYSGKNLTINGFVVPGTDTGAEKVYAAEVDNFDSVSITSDGTNSGSIARIMVNGLALIDANIQDTVVDSPLNNYAVLDNYAVLEGGSEPDLANGNLVVKTTGGGPDRIAFSTLQTPVNGAYYAEYTARTADALVGFSPNQTQADQLGSGSNQVAYYSDNGYILAQGPGYVETGWESWGAGDIIGLACNATDLFFWKNGVYQGSYSKASASGWYFGAGNNNQAYAFNFGQQPFVYGEHDLETGTVVSPQGDTYQALYQSRGQVAATGRLYCVLDAGLNVTDLQSDDPGFTLVQSPATVTFPSALPSSETPDEALPDGVSFGSEIQVSNDEGTDTATLVQVTP